MTHYLILYDLDKYGHRKRIGLYQTEYQETVDRLKMDPRFEVVTQEEFLIASLEMFILRLSGVKE